MKRRAGGACESTRSRLGQALAVTRPLETVHSAARAAEMRCGRDSGMQSVRFVPVTVTRTPPSRTHTTLQRTAREDIASSRKPEDGKRNLSGAREGAARLITPELLQRSTDPLPTEKLPKVACWEQNSPPSLAQTERKRTASLTRCVFPCDSLESQCSNLAVCYRKENPNYAPRSRASPACSGSEHRADGPRSVLGATAASQLTRSGRHP